MSRVLLISLLSSLFAFAALADELDAWDQPTNSSPQAPLQPQRVTPNAYGPDINMDETGRPFVWRGRDGQKAQGSVKQNAYGPGVSMDATGRPVKAIPEQ
jgi:hypothetical protein